MDHVNAGGWVVLKSACIVVSNFVKVLNWWTITRQDSSWSNQRSSHTASQPLWPREWTRYYYIQTMKKFIFHYRVLLNSRVVYNDRSKLKMFFIWCRLLRLMWSGLFQLRVQEMGLSVTATILFRYVCVSPLYTTHLLSVHGLSTAVRWIHC